VISFIAVQVKDYQFAKLVMSRPKPVIFSLVDMRLGKRLDASGFLDRPYRGFCRPLA
jgi:hypothetical protein